MIFLSQKGNTKLFLPKTIKTKIVKVFFSYNFLLQYSCYFWAFNNTIQFQHQIEVIIGTQYHVAIKNSRCYIKVRRDDAIPQCSITIVRDHVIVASEQLLFQLRIQTRFIN